MSQNFDDQNFAGLIVDAANRVNELIEVTESLLSQGMEIEARLLQIKAIGAVMRLRSELIDLIEQQKKKDNAANKD
jgi:hypothetical protein